MPVIGNMQLFINIKRICQTRKQSMIWNLITNCNLRKMMQHYPQIRNNIFKHWNYKVLFHHHKFSFKIRVNY